jgi:hypothetical protein
LDTILIHNTLILMSKSARVDALMAFVRRLAPQGIILCNVRYLMRIDGKDHSLALDEADAIEKKIKTTFAAYPGVVDLIEPMIMPFVLAQNASLSTRPYKAELIAELDLAGLEIIAAYPEDAAMPQMVSQGNAALKLNAEMLLLRCKAKA